MVTPIEVEEPLGVLLARCYRLARERARIVREAGQLAAEETSDDEAQFTALMRGAANNELPCG